MPANLTPEYLEAERKYRQATAPEDQLAALREMLATVPKHKGTEKLQADIKRRMSRLREESSKKGATARTRPVYVIDYEGAGQVPIVGAPNAGKTALVAALSDTSLRIADYPYTTQRPAPAMMPFENAQVQLVDTPPASEEYAPDWIAELVRRADALVLVADLARPDAWAGPAYLVELLRERGIELVAARVARPDASEGEEAGSPSGDEAAEVVSIARAREERAASDDDGGAGLAFHVPAVLVGAKHDADGAAGALEELREYFDGRLPILAASAESGEGLERVREALFRSLRVIRVCSKEPGEEPDRERPWILPEGSTVGDLAQHIHRDLAEGFRYGRLWGSGRFEGQRVGEEYVLHDQDVVEIHAS